MALDVTHLVLEPISQVLVDAAQERLRRACVEQDLRVLAQPRCKLEHQRPQVGGGGLRRRHPHPRSGLVV